MQLRHRSAVLAAVAGIALTGLATAPAQAASPANPVVKAAAGTPARTFTTEGTVSALDAAAGKLTVAAENGGGSTTVTVTPKAAVTIDKATAKLAGLPVGARVKVNGTVSNGVNLATTVDATTSWPMAGAGTVKAVDATTRTVTVDHLLLADEVVTVADNAKITLDGRTVALAAVPVKARIALTGTVTNGKRVAKTVVALSRWQLNLTGTISAVDAATGKITVRSGDGATLNLAVNPDATIKLNGVKVALKDLPLGATVTLTGTDTTAGATIAGIDAKAATKKN
ncbi:hypothetical protein [Actinoplanes sp. NPDC049265]|uniref:hypothetical protein n=1 Tax=Actinoplanes sp. NPDC049265 TaxID=3363902 RepID=UPI003710D6F5